SAVTAQVIELIRRSAPTFSGMSGGSAVESRAATGRLTWDRRCSSAAEQGSHKPRVGGSIPPTATNSTHESGDDVAHDLPPCFGFVDLEHAPGVRDAGHGLVRKRRAGDQAPSRVSLPSAPP